MNILINKGINEESFEELLKASNTDCQHINIYLEGDGGKVSILNMFLHLINFAPERYTIIVAGYNASCNFDLILYSKCKKVVMPYAVGGFHMSYTKVEISSNNTPTYQEGELRARCDKEILWPKQLKQAKQLKLSKKQMSEFKKSYMVYFLADEIKEFIKQDWEY